MSIRDEFESWYEKLNDHKPCRNKYYAVEYDDIDDQAMWKAYQAAHQSQQQRIDLLESAIRDFVINDVAMDLACIERTPDYDLCEKWSISRANLRNLMEQS
ncbi:MAG: hypothetical protein H7Z73_12370 [Candidatus Saccharibacteria bacterium]|nr:hypothetical protein [Moraxellaceae bacterium]